MKVLLLLVMLFPLCLQAQSQSDSLKIAFQRIENINLHLDKCHKDYNSGTTLVIAGAIVTGIGIYSALNDEGDAGNYLMLGGGAIITTGSIIQIVSHRHIGRTRRSLIL